MISIMLDGNHGMVAQDQVGSVCLYELRGTVHHKTVWAATRASKRGSSTPHVCTFVVGGLFQSQHHIDQRRFAGSWETNNDGDLA
jgi:hypothetical protein